MASLSTYTTLLPSVSVARGGAYTGPYGASKPTPDLVSYGDYQAGAAGAPNGVVDGFTEVKGTPNAPLSCRVRLVRERDGKVVREVFSHPTTGYYSFSGLPSLEIYTVLTYHPTHDYRAVVADNLTPEVQP